MSDFYSDFFRFLAPLFQSEYRAGGDAAANALMMAANMPSAPSKLDAAKNPMPATLCQDVLTRGPLPDLVRFSHVLSTLNWHCAGLEDGRIRPEIAHHMYTAELIGPDGLVFNPDLRAGVFLQEAGLDYVTRSHAAEECFHMMAGEGFWSTYDGPSTPQGAGAAILHPSDTPHRSETRDHPMLAAWRWSGDIGWDSYQLKG